VHFLKHYDPQVHVDVVEIDPAVVKIADEYFECRTGGNIHVITADGVQYLETTESRYDVIYLDAFLKPTSETDATGTPLRMKTRQFYEALQSKLRPEGVVVFNVNRHSASDADLAAIRGSFAQAYVFRPNAANFVVVGTLAATREPATALRTKAHEADSRFKSSFSFQEMTKHMLP
jgi:spermidine synthase